LINFAITESGLKDQMLSLVVAFEKAELEQERELLIKTNAENEEKLKNYENDILKGLEKSDPDKILDEDDLIDKLATTKIEANRIKHDQQIANLREKFINNEREKYITMAWKTAILFFTLTDMVNIDHM